MTHEYLRYRIRSTATSARPDAAGVPVVRPVGGHAVYWTRGRCSRTSPPLEYPGQALAVALYEGAACAAARSGR